MNFKAILLGLFIISNFCSNASIHFDSLGLELRDGKQHIKHKVVQGETLYGISRRYKSDVNTIKSINGLIDGALAFGQIIFIPFSSSATTPAKAENHLHVVSAGETLYGISRQYGISVNELMTINGLTASTLETGQRIIIKKTTQIERIVEQQVELPKNELTSESSAISHTVAPSETLYSISRKYNLSVDEIKANNDLSSNSLSVGQVLKISNPKEALITEEPKIPLEIREPTQDLTSKVEIIENVETIKDSTTINLPVSAPAVVKDTVIQPVTKQYGNYDKSRQTAEGFEQIVEEGFAMKIENSPNTQKYLALHRTLAIGKILQVRNQMNNQSIYVRVVGKLPDTGPNKNVLIRLSDQAFERLGAFDAKIPVEVTYLP